MTVLTRFLLLAVLGLGIVGQAVRAQDATPPVSSPAAEPDQATDTSPAASGSGNLFPETGPAAGQQAPLAGRPRPSRLLGNKNKRNARAADILSEEADSDPLEVRIAFRRAKTLAMAQDPGMPELLHRAAAAPTDKAKREWLRQYYDRLFADIRKIDPSPSLAAHVALLTKIAQQRYDPQRRMLAGEEDLVNGRRGRR
jgi:hypothetical protein